MDAVQRLVHGEVVVVGDRLFVVSGVERVDGERAELVGGGGAEAAGSRRRVLTGRGDLVVRAAQVAGHGVVLGAADGTERAGRVIVGVVEAIDAEAAAEDRLAVAVEVIGQAYARRVEERAAGCAGGGDGRIGLVPADTRVGVRVLRNGGVGDVLRGRRPDRQADAVGVKPRA